MRLPFSIVLGGALVLSLAACAGSTGGLGSVPSPVSTPTTSPDADQPRPDPCPERPDRGVRRAVQRADRRCFRRTRASPTPGSPASGTMTVRSYFVLGGEPGSVGLVPVLRIVPKTVAVATAAMNALLKGPDPDVARERTMTTAIPDGSRLLGLTIKSGVATVDLSTEFDSGGGSASLQYRLAQVVYTLTQFSTVRSVVFQVEGQTVTVFGSEGIVLDGPVGRSDYTDQLPAIFVDRPAYGAALSNPGESAATPTSSRRHSGSRSSMGRAPRSSTGRSWRRAAPAAAGPSRSRCRTPSRRRSGGPFGSTTHRRRTGRRRTTRDYPVWLTPAS